MHEHITCYHRSLILLLHTSEGSAGLLHQPNLMLSKTMGATRSLEPKSVRPSHRSSVPLFRPRVLQQLQATSGVQPGSYVIPWTIGAARGLQVTGCWPALYEKQKFASLLWPKGPRATLSNQQPRNRRQRRTCGAPEALKEPVRIPVPSGCALARKLTKPLSTPPASRTCHTEFPLHLDHPKRFNGIVS